MTASDNQMADHANRRRPNREVTVAPSLVADLLGYIGAKGGDVARVCSSANIDVDTLANREERVRGAQMDALWKAAKSELNDDDIALHATVNANPGTLDIVGYVMLSSTTALEALRRGARLIRLLNDGIAVDVDCVGNDVNCRLRMLHPSDAYLQSSAREIAEAILVGVVHQVRLLTGQNVIPSRVSFRHAMPSGGDANHRTLFGATPLFNAERDEVVLKAGDVDIALRSANPQLLTSFEEHANAALTALDSSSTLTDRVQREIIERLKGEAPSVNEVARALAMSGRNLQRGLFAEGTTYQALLDDARRALALRHLSDPKATVAKVAWLVGFSEPSAFHRAFRRWTGTSPRRVA